MSKKSAQELFPNLFAAKPRKAPARDMSPADMRLLQFAMRQATRRPAMPPRLGAPVARPQAPAAAAARRPEAARPTSRPLPRAAQR